MKHVSIFVLLFVVLTIMPDTTQAKTVSVTEASAAVEAQVEQAHEQTQQARSHLFQLESTWEICDTYQYRQRRSVGWSRAGLKQIVTNCRPVQTVCEAVVTGEQAYVNPECFYAAKTASQTRQWKGSKLQEQNLQRMIQRYQQAGSFIALFWK